MSSFTISELEAENAKDVRQVVRLCEDVFWHPQWSDRFPVPNVARMITGWLKLDRETSRKIFVAKTERGKIVGVAVGNVSIAREHSPDLRKKLGREKTYYLRALAVHPDHRRKKIAAALTEARLQHARQLNCGVAFGGTPAINEAQINHFKKGGFEAFHIEPPKTEKEVEVTYYRKMLR